MFELRNRELRVDVLDPVADAARLGTRYCWGGYIWQVHDHTAGPLLTGPEWPEPAPTAFNGQGLPESFRHRTLDGRPLTWRDRRGISPGIGELHRDENDQVSLAQRCPWEITTGAEHLIFATHHEAAGFSYALIRTIVLESRELRSMTALTNTSRQERLTLEWFAHPFFALVDSMARVELPADTLLPENPGFSLTGRALTQKRRFVRQDDGHMDRGLRLAPGQPLIATLPHPALTHIGFETSFAPDSCVIWGNDRTFSIEPYLTLDLAPGETRRWELCYRFGASSGISVSSVSSRSPAAR
jgi:hypothetical protein